MTSMWRGRAAALMTALVLSTTFGIQSGDASSRRAPKEGVENPQNTVAIVSGTPAGTYLQFAYDMSVVLDEMTGDGLRVLPMLGKGGAQNIRDVLALKGVDMGIAQTTDLARLKAEQADIGNRLSYIAKLYNEELHVLARQEIRTLADLAGKAVNFSDLGGGTQFVARELFQKTGVDVREVNMGQADALEKMKSGEIAATVYVAGKPGPAFARAPNDLGFHFLPVAYGRALRGELLSGEPRGQGLSRASSPTGKPVETIAVGAVLDRLQLAGEEHPLQAPRRLRAGVLREDRGVQEGAAPSEMAGGEPRRRRGRLAALRAGGAHPARRRRADRLGAARRRRGGLRAEFDRFAKERGLTGSSREKVFDEFLRWREGGR